MKRDGAVVEYGRPLSSQAFNRGQLYELAFFLIRAVLAFGFYGQGSFVTVTPPHLATIACILFDIAINFQPERFDG